VHFEAQQIFLCFNKSITYEQFLLGGMTKNRNDPSLTSPKVAGVHFGKNSSKLGLF
jgi:hypothetical protein